MALLKLVRPPAKIWVRVVALNFTTAPFLCFVLGEVGNLQSEVTKAHHNQSKLGTGLTAVHLEVNSTQLPRVRKSLRREKEKQAGEVEDTTPHPDRPVPTPDENLCSLQYILIHRL